MARMSALFVLVCACVCVAAAPVPRPPAPHPPSNTNCTPVGFVVVQPVAIFTTDQPIRITALASLFINCGRAPQIMWSVGTFTRQGPTLVLAASSLAAGDYVATVKMLDESSTIASAQVAITIIDAQPTIAIVGGDRTTDATQPIAFLAQVSTVTSVQWSACLLDGSGQCASNSPKFKFMQLDTPFTSAAVLSTGFKTIGMVQVTATAIGASAASRASASVNVNVISADVNTVIIRSTTPRDVLPGFPVAVVALASQPFSTFNWTTSDGSTATGPFATFFPRSVGTFTVSVTASGLNGGLAGNASYAFNVGQLPSATCSISSTDAVVSGGESPITIQLDSWRAGNRDGGFRFGIRTLNGFVSLSPDFSEFTNLTAVAPLVAGDGVISIELQTKIAGAIATAAKCDINVTAPSNISEILDARASLLKSAILAADTATSLRSAFDIASVTLGMATNQYNVTGALADLVNSAAAFTSTEKGSAVDILDLALTSLTNIGEETQANIVTVLSRLINTTDGVILDFATRAQTVAGLISQLDPNNLPANRTAKKQLAQQLAVGIASQLALGASANITSGSISITATKLPATQVSAGGAFNASGGSGSIAVPLGALASALNMSAEDVALFNADVAVSATVHSSNPVPTASVEGGKALSGAIVEFDVTATGANFGSGLSVAITVGVRSSPKGTCVYFDTTANAWSTAGVTTVGYDASTGQLLCNTTHLSMFSASVDIAGVTKAPAPVSSSSAPTAPFTTAPAATTVIQNSTGAASDDTTSSSSSGLSPTAIGVIAAVAVLLLVAGVLAVIAISKLKRRRNEASTSNPSKRAELYATSVEMSATIGQSTSDKDEHTASRPPIKATDLNFSQV